MELTAHSVSDSGYIFDHWEDENGAYVSDSAVLTVTMDSDRAGRAVFRKQTQPGEFFLNIEIVPEGAGKVTSDSGIDCPSECSASFDEGTEVELTAHSVSDSGYIFDHWEDGNGTYVSDTASLVLTMDSDRAGRAVFTEQTLPGEFSLDVGVFPEGAGKVTSDSGIDCPTVCSASFTSGTEVELTAHSVSGYIFDHWEDGNGTYVSDTASLVLTMDSDRAGRAVFREQTQPGEFSLDVDVVPEGAGKVTSDSGIDCPTVCSASFTSGTEVELTAHSVSDSGYIFDHW
ncbi:MAG: hypothetical protein GY820_02845, partial [Gammaproteobacteria bacterium]|nr:hypothetical protein [Gammaproteobacteria bacterium]